MSIVTDITSNLNLRLVKPKRVGDPDYFWSVQYQLTGDLSGGVVTGQWYIQQLMSNLKPIWWTVEAWGITSDDTNVGECHLAINNGSPVFENYDSLGSGMVVISKGLTTRVGAYLSWVVHNLHAQLGYANTRSNRAQLEITHNTNNNANKYDYWANGYGFKEPRYYNGY